MSNDTTIQETYTFPFISADEPCGLHWHTCYMIIMGICKGLHYLHSLHYGPQSPTLYHLDLKPTNILMDRYMMPKIGGFGLSRIFASLRTNDIAEETRYVKNNNK